jgi:hypothetical protein
LPVDAAASGDLAAANVNGRIDPSTRRGSFSVALEWTTPPARVEWFPEADPALEVSNVSVANENGRSRIAFDAEVYQGQQLASNRLATIVVFTDTRGVRRGLPVVIPLQ